MEYSQIPVSLCWLLSQPHHLFLNKSVPEASRYLSLKGHKNISVLEELRWVTLSAMGSCLCIPGLRIANKVCKMERTLKYRYSSKYWHSMINALLVLTPTSTLNPAEQDTVFSLTKVVYSSRKEGEEEATSIWYQTMPWAPAGSSHILPC